VKFGEWQGYGPENNALNFGRLDYS